MKNTNKIIAQAIKEKRKVLLETEAKLICKDYNMPITKFDLATSQKEAVTIADKIGYPLVLKVVSPDISHKTEVGGVLVNLQNVKQLKTGYLKILDNVKRYKPKAKIIGVLVEEMAPKSIEVIVGAIKDTQFGQTLMFGLGGIFVEILKDTTFHIAPITEQEAKEMITGIKAYPLLTGYRNNPPVDIKSIIKTLLGTSKLVIGHPEIKEIDFNPIIIYEKGAKIVDARIVLE